MVNRRISVYIPQTNPFTCPIDTFFIVRQTKNRLAVIDFSFAAEKIPPFNLLVHPSKKVEKRDTFSSLVYYSSLSCLASKSLISFSCTSAGTSS